MIWKLIVSAMIGMIAGAITNRRDTMGCLANTVAGLLGSYIGQSLFGDWGPIWGNIAVIPAILGAIIVIALVSLFEKR